MADLLDDDHDTEFHDHDRSAGAVAVVSGAVREERLAIDGPPRERTCTVGDTFFTSPRATSTACATPAPIRRSPSMSLPAARGMGAYAVEDDGRWVSTERSSWQTLMIGSARARMVP
jgi:hypothetical protein